MKTSISIMMAIAVCVSSSSILLVSAQAPKPTVGHSATLIDNVVFIQGGSSAANTPSNAAYSLTLGKGGTYNGATMLDITTLAAFSARDYHSSVKSVGGLMINCGGLDRPDAAGSTQMTCDVFNPKYNSTKLDMSSVLVNSRGGMAIAIGGTSAYYTGGSAGPGTGPGAGFSTDMNVLVLATNLKWRVGTPMPVATRFHTATWVESLNSMIILGGQIENGSAVAMNSASVFSGVTWTTRPIAGDAVAARYGHTAVEDEKGSIYIYGGQTSATATPLNDVFFLNTSAATWAWKKINVANAEPRVFHASVMLPDNTILHTFGRAGLDQASAVNTFSLFNVASSAWTPAAALHATIANVSPNKGPDTSNNPTDPNFKHPGNEEAEGKSSKGGIIGGAIGGILAVAALAGGFIFYRKRQANRHSNGSVAAGPYSKHSGSASGQLGRSSLNLDDSDKAKLGRSFTIRQPAAAYVDNNGVQDLKHMSPYDGSNNNGYGGEPAVIEYELTDTSGHRYEPGSVAERKRYVEEQQRQLMSGFESVYPDQPLPFQHQQPRSNNNNNNQQDQDYFGSPTLTNASSPIGGRSPSQSRRNQSQSLSEQGGAMSPSSRHQQAHQYHDQSDQLYSNKF
ncbi:hypothetical protein BGX23_009207 [Mortierella sp. AD031]|nr:hypothetical protein BGX23_009207 [Mortierella sp. AD031]KAG0218264.1 hypothetical protein BGX33_007942 [Mortierella sp. NVP41]